MVLRLIPANWANLVCDNLRAPMRVESWQEIIAWPFTRPTYLAAMHLGWYGETMALCHLPVIHARPMRHFP
jgi:hypothetical protein